MALGAASVAHASATVPSGTLPERQAAFAANERLGRGINLGNALESPRGTSWGMELKETYFDLIAEAGFDSVRIPVRWSDYALEEPPYTIEPAFFARVDTAIDQALARELAVVVNLHHYEALFADPPAHRERFLTLWEQIAEHYRDQPATLYFEILNEPNGQLDAITWNAWLPEALKVVRETNPTRIVIVDCAEWGNVAALPKLVLPEDDPYLIASFHYYNPFAFTHQGAEWVGGEEKYPVGVEWQAHRAERLQLRADLQVAADFSDALNRPLFLGEFGAYQTADLRSRVRWTRFVARTATDLGFSIAYWEFGAGFGLYDREEGAWRVPLRNAVLGQSEPSDP